MSELPNQHEQKLQTYDNISNNWSVEQVESLLNHWQKTLDNAQKQFDYADKQIRQDIPAPNKKYWQIQKENVNRAIVTAKDKINWFNYALNKAKLKNLKNQNNG